MRCGLKKPHGKISLINSVKCKTRAISRQMIGEPGSKCLGARFSLNLMYND
jgi:hypothetical protein